MNRDVIIACDFNGREATLDFLDKFAGQERKPFVKIGMELFYSAGPDIVREIKARGHRIFLDWKLHDIPNTGKKAIFSNNGLVTTIAASESDEPEYALEGSVFVAGAAVQWLRDSMRMVKSASQTEEYADRVRDSAGVYVVPAFTGMGAPYWDQYARGTVFGITRGCTKEHFIRATLESIAYQSYDVMKAMEEDLGAPLQGLKVDGGASANNFLMKFQADLVGTKVIRPKCIETTAMGAAFLAGLAVGYYKDKDEIREKWELGRSFEPAEDRSGAEDLLKGWHKAVKYAIAWSKDE